jgi:hypothetical protein
MAQFPKSKGALFLNSDKAGEKHPDLRGHLHITPEQIQMLIAMGQAGGDVKLQVAGWQRTSQAGAAYIYIEGEAYMKQPTQQAQGGYVQPQQQAPAQMMPQQQVQQQVPQQQVQQQPVQQQVPQQQVPQQQVYGSQPPAGQPIQQQAPQPPMQQQVAPQQLQGYTNQPVENDFEDNDIPF